MGVCVRVGGCCLKVFFTMADSLENGDSLNKLLFNIQMTYFDYILNI